MGDFAPTGHSGADCGDPVAVPEPPRELERWDNKRDDWWKYAVYVNGVHEPRAVRADAGRGTVTVAVYDGMIYHVKDGKTELRTGKVLIILKPSLRADLMRELAGHGV